MRKILSIVLLCMLLSTAVVCAAAEESGADPAILTAWQSFVTRELSAMAESATGWSHYVLGHAQIVSVQFTGKNDSYVEAVVSLPVLVADKNAAVLSDAMLPYIQCTDRTEVLLSASYTEQNGQWDFTYSANKPGKITATVKSIVNRCKKGYTSKAFVALLNDALFPRTAKMPKKAPTEPVDMSSLPETYAESAASALGITPEQASRRLPVLLMLCEITKADDSTALEQTSLTIRVKDIPSVLEQADALTRSTLSKTVNAAGLGYSELQAIFCESMQNCWAAAWYKTGRASVTNHTVTADIPAIVNEGPGASGVLSELLAPYMQQIDQYLSDEMTYAASLPYYPVIPLIDTGILSGAADEGSPNVRFDMGEQTSHHGYVSVTNAEGNVFTAFILKGTKLNVCLQPGTYTVLYGAGPSWYGEEYLFGDEGRYESFTLVLSGAPITRVCLQADGDVSTTSVSCQDVVNAR